METPQLLPDNILQKQVCQECFQYLSVPPILTNSRGETICGRCVGEFGRSRFTKYTKSYFNVIAEKFLFKCTNHFNGCAEVLSLDGMKEHEEICSFKKKQDCFICSFSGNLSQIVNHSLKLHPDNVSFDGKCSFWLKDCTFKNKFILLVDEDVFHVTIAITDELFTVIVSAATKILSKTSSIFGVNFSKQDDPLNFDFICTHYSLLTNNLINYYEKKKGELFVFFGSDIQVCCQILVGSFLMYGKEVEFQNKFAELRRSEIELNNIKQIVQTEKFKLPLQNDAYHTAIDLIKKKYYDLFKCCSCQKLTSEDLFYCPKMHFHCQQCLTNICKVCNMVRELKKLEGLDNLMVTCDWSRCNSYLKVRDYFDHKSSCPERPYKCPLQDCQEVVFSADNLIDHWHSEFPKLVTDKCIKCEIYGAGEYYWLINYDLYRVLVNFSKSIIQVLIDDVSVLSYNTIFKCSGVSGGVSNRVRGVVQDFAFSVFCDKFNININNSIRYREDTYHYTQINIFTV